MEREGWTGCRASGSILSLYLTVDLHSETSLLSTSVRYRKAPDTKGLKAVPIGVIVAVRD